MAPGTLAKDKTGAVGRRVHAGGGAQGGHTQTARWGANLGHPDGARSSDSTGTASGVATAVRARVLRVELWLSSRTQRASIRRYLEAGMMEGGVTSVRTEGTPQGGPLSTLLSNILLTDLDRELEKRGHRFCRYADDCNVYVGSQRSRQRSWQRSLRFWSKG
jgi:Reverse transcriptase (RNA-dependent DNA polymerase)